MSRPLIYSIWVVLALAAVALTSMTFLRYLDSYRAVRQFHLDLTEVTQDQEDPRNLSARVVFRNSSDIRVDIKNLVTVIRWEGKGIASVSFPPEPLTVPPGQELPVVIDFQASVREDRLPPPTHGQDPRWSLTATASLSFPVQKDLIRLQMKGDMLPP